MESAICTISETCHSGYRLGMRFQLSALDAHFPTALHHANPPVFRLFGSGNSELVGTDESRRGLAIVGSRQATPQGLADARWFAREASQAGMTIVSGMALGIDASAHQGALDAKGSTIAVLGHGLDHVYPSQHSGLANTIVSNAGCLVTEYPDGTPPRPFHFPLRNRIIAGLSRAVVVIEAAPQSGSLSTARHALDLGLDVFVIPGSIHQTQCQGSNDLIRQGAHLVQSPQQLLEDIGALPIRPKRRGVVSQRSAGGLASPDARQAGLGSDLDPETTKVLGHLDFQAAAVSGLVSRTGLTQECLYGCLLILELSGLVNRTQDGRWLKYRPLS